MEIMISFIFSSLTNYVFPFITLLGVLIFVHELGHFLVARWCGVRVEVFSLGFGKKIFQYKPGDTNYCISIVPLGGYVKMFGDQPGVDVSEEERKYSFTHKTVWQRIAIVLAGPLMNFFFAILIYSIIAIIGENLKSTKLADITPGSPVEKAGLRSGDLIVAVNNTPVQTAEEMYKLMDHRHQSEVTLKVKHEGSEEIVDIQVPVSSKPNPNLFAWKDQISDLDGVTPYSRGTVVGITPSSPLAALKVRTGDQLISISRGMEPPQKVTYWREIEKFFSQTPVSQPITFEFQRPAEQAATEPEKSEAGDLSKVETFKITLDGKALVSSYSAENLGFESSELYLDQIMEKSPAEAAGLKKGDRLISIDNFKITKWEDVLSRIKDFKGDKRLTFEVLRDGNLIKTIVEPKMTKTTNTLGLEEERFVVGIGPIINFAPPEIITLTTANPFKAIYRGTVKTVDFSFVTLMTFVRLFQNKVSPKNIGGIISIGQAASETFKMGIFAFLQMMAMLSVNLFVLNLLPIPILDGGHMVFYTIEVIRGAPLSLRKMEIAQQVGMILLMSLMLFAFVNDLTRFFKL